MEEIKDNESINKREKIISEITKKNDIRAIKPEYRLILDKLQDDSPMSINELTQEINHDYDFELFVYKQIWDNVRALIDLGAIKNNELTKQISINPEYILYPETLPISSYCVYIFAISAIFLLTSIATKTFLEISVSIFVAGLLYLAGQHYGSKFEFRR
jgi:hypothetical protein